MAAVLTSGVFAAAPAAAEDGFSNRIAEALAAVPAEHRLLQDTAARDSGQAQVAVDPSTEVVVRSQDQAALKVSLPFAESAKDGVRVGATIAYDNGNGSATVPVAKSDGSVQIATVIERADAPTSYRYGISGTTLRLLDEGAVIAEDAAGNYQGAVAAPWAYDANGTPVSTRYEVDGSTLTQVIDHAAGSYTYPIVADPWLGINLFKRITVDSYKGEPRVNLQLSAWGAAQWGGGVAGQVVMNTAGWDEARNWNNTVRSGLDKPSQRQQFECHALGAPFAGTWNLEKFRPNRTTHWTYGVAVHHCNWKTSNRY